MKDVEAPNGREYDLMWLLAVGRTRHDVATALETSESGVSRMLAELFARYRVANTTSLIARALVLGHIELNSAHFPDPNPEEF